MGRQRAALRSALGRAGLMRNSSCASTRPTGDLLTMLTVCLCSLPPDPTHRLGPGTEPYSMHTGFNPSKSGYIQQHYEDCGPMHNNCVGGSYMDEDYTQPGWY